MRNSREKFLLAVSNVRSLIKDYFFMCKSRNKDVFFTKTTKLNFETMMLLMLNFNKRSIQLEIDDFFENIRGKEMDITKQAFINARKKVSEEAFIIMNDELQKLIYCGDGDFKTYKGFVLMAIDGTVLEIKNTEELRLSFGYQENQVSMLARARASTLYDIGNNMIFDAKIGRYNKGEQSFALEHIEKIKEIGIQKALILYDRGYPSTNLIEKHEKCGIKYLMRVSSQFLKEINEAKDADQIVKIKGKDSKELKVRVITLKLDSGLEEKLITNVFSNEIRHDEFKELYFRRWTIEGKYAQLKGKLQLENFTSETELGIKQDFYATVYLMNMAALAKQAADYELEIKNADKELEYHYETNMNILVGKLKDNLILMVATDDVSKREEILDYIMRKLMKNTIPKIENRHNKRNKKLKKPKYPMNSKKCI